MNGNVTILQFGDINPSRDLSAAIPELLLNPLLHFPSHYNIWSVPNSAPRITLTSQTSSRSRFRVMIKSTMYRCFNFNFINKDDLQSQIELHVCTLKIIIYNTIKI